MQNLILTKWTNLHLAFSVEISLGGRNGWIKAVQLRHILPIKNNFFSGIAFMLLIFNQASYQLLKTPHRLPLSRSGHVKRNIVQ